MSNDKEFELNNKSVLRNCEKAFDEQIRIDVANSKGPRNYASGGISIVDTSRHLDNMDIMKMLTSTDTSELQEALDKLWWNLFIIWLSHKNKPGN